jgi:MFS family permease
MSNSGSDSSFPEEKKGNFVVEYFKSFGVLRETRAEYWGMQVINFIDHTILFAVYTIAVLYFSAGHDQWGFGMDDRWAGIVYTVFASSTTMCLFFSGLISDWLGIRVSMFVNQGVLLFIRAGIVGITFTQDTFGAAAPWIMIVLFVAQAPFLAIGQTAFQAANKRFTTPKSRSAGFNLWYLFMNVGAFFAGLLIDLIFIGFDLPRVHVFTVGVFTAVICLFCIAFFVRREEQLKSPDEEAETDAEAEGEIEADEPALAEKPKRMNPWQNFLAVAREPVFWRFTCLITLLIPVRAVFLYMHLLMPKFWERVIGPDAYIGLLTSINPFLVIIGLILLIPILNKFSVYKMLTYGAIVSGISLFVLAIPPVMSSDWASWWPWLHENLATIAGFTYIMSIVCLVVLTIGEVIWSPRLVEYTAAIAPEGQEGTYLGFSMVPYFVAKTFVSAASGFMLARWCDKPPDDQPLLVRETVETAIANNEFVYWDSPWAMWFILAVPAVGGPLIALLLKNWFTKGAHFKHGDHEE